MHSLRKSLTVAAAATFMLAAAGAASAQSGVNIGTLSCNVAPGIGFIIGSSKSMECQFSGSHGIELYSGVINKFGLDIGVTGNQVLNWVVFAPGSVDPGALGGTYVGATAEATAAIGAGALGGTYVGATAEATAAIGAGANVLVGGFNRTFTLQPVSLSTQTGLNVAAGVAELVLHPR